MLEVVFMLVKNYPVVQKKLNQIKRTFYFFLVGSIWCWGITIYRFMNGIPLKWMFITSVTATFFAFVYFIWPKRAHFTIDENNIVDFCDGFIKNYHFDITKCYNFSYKKSTQRLLGMDEHYYRMTMNFIFGEDNFDDFVKFIYYKKVKAVNADLADEKYRAEMKEQEEYRERQKLKKKKQKMKQKARKLAEKEAKKAAKASVQADPENKEQEQ